MKMEWVRLRRLPDWPRWAVLLVGLWLALGACAVVLERYTGTPARLCLFKRLTHLPCLTCGSTRGLAAMLRGDLARAWLYNPLVYTLLIACCVLLLLRLALGRRPRVYLTRTQRRLAWSAAAAVVLANWVYVILYVG